MIHAVRYGGRGGKEGRLTAMVNFGGAGRNVPYDLEKQELLNIVSQFGEIIAPIYWREENFS